MTAPQMPQGYVVKVSGPLVVARGLDGAKMYEMARVGKLGLFGEIIEIRGDRYSIQVYEETEGIAPASRSSPPAMPLSVELGPGLLQSIYDGVQRPLDVLHGEVRRLHRARRRKPRARPRRRNGLSPPSPRPGDAVVRRRRPRHRPGDRSHPPQDHGAPGRQGHGRSPSRPASSRSRRRSRCIETENGDQRSQAHAALAGAHAAPRRAQSSRPTIPLITGQRVIDMFFPMAKGGTGCVPGPFGSGKTVVQHQLAKWADADIIIFIGCGERGNEMTDVLLEFPAAQRPQDRPARSWSAPSWSPTPPTCRWPRARPRVFTGITMAEYYRDMGYDVALMADSTTRWAEAMREMSGRLEEMPGEEGYPAYLASRLAAFYERAGPGHLPRQGRAPGERQHHRRGLALRAATSPTPWCRDPPRDQGLLGPRRPARVPAPLPGHQLAHQLLALPGSRRPLGGEERRPGLADEPPRRHGPPQARGGAPGTRPPGRHGLPFADRPAAPRSRPA